MRTILATLELKAETDPVLSQATALAKACGAKLWVLHVAAPEPDFVGYQAGPQYIRDVRASDLKQERHRMQSLMAGLVAQQVDASSIMVFGPTAETILHEAERLGADLIVMGTHGRSGLAKAFLGSTSDDVLRANRFNVLIVPPVNPRGTQVEQPTWVD
ncbi:MAG: universal stress protein [Flavobacteriales bacterium]|nr:universal stress protein [Flavobacteriales bacterium]MBP9080497.1 universal stress protein [Flavobacteriales bacterium]